MNPKDIRMQLARKQQNAYIHAMEIIDKIIPVIEKFDGKQANKRLETALQQIDRNLYFRKSIYSNMWEMRLYITDRSITDTESKYRNTYYIKDSDIWLTQEFSVDRFVDENGKWKSQTIIQRLKETQDVLKDKDNTIQEQLDDIDSLIDRCAEIKREIEEFNRMIDYSVREYFNLKI